MRSHSTKPLPISVFNTDRQGSPRSLTVEFKISTYLYCIKQFVNCLVELFYAKFIVRRCNRIYWNFFLSWNFYGICMKNFDILYFQVSVVGDPPVTLFSRGFAIRSLSFNLRSLAKVLKLSVAFNRIHAMYILTFLYP